MAHDKARMIAGELFLQFSVYLISLDEGQFRSVTVL
jgi:hypothetical protein